jgi:hypothetical protein
VEFCKRLGKLEYPIFNIQCSNEQLNSLKGTGGPHSGRPPRGLIWNGAGGIIWNDEVAPTNRRTRFALGPGHCGQAVPFFLTEQIIKARRAANKIR